MTNLAVFKQGILALVILVMAYGVLDFLVYDTSEVNIEFGISETIERSTGVPAQILADFVFRGGLFVHFFGTEREKHEFAKGRWTRFGTASFDYDRFLKRRGWSEKKIHGFGNFYGYSQLLR